MSLLSSGHRNRKTIEKAAARAAKKRDNKPNGQRPIAESNQSEPYLVVAVNDVVQCLLASAPGRDACTCSCFSSCSDDCCQRAAPTSICQPAVGLVQAVNLHQAKIT